MLHSKMPLSVTKQVLGMFWCIKKRSLPSFKLQTGISAKEERRQKLLKYRSSQWAMQFGDTCDWAFGSFCVGRQHVRLCLWNQAGNFLHVSSTVGKALNYFPVNTHTHTYTMADSGVKALNWEDNSEFCCGPSSTLSIVLGWLLQVSFTFERNCVNLTLIAADSVSSS